MWRGLRRRRDGGQRDQRLRCPATVFEDPGRSRTLRSAKRTQTEKISDFNVSGNEALGSSAILTAVRASFHRQDVDARVKPAHDGVRLGQAAVPAPSADLSR
jgi:hypothetical protein